MATSRKSVNTPNVEYALGYTNEEHERLILQAARIAPITERLFLQAGIGPGQRVLDLGSGVGDVALLVARLVGPKGEVVGIERNAVSIARATARVHAAGLRNVRFIQTDLNRLSSNDPFDAVVGRFILMFLPDPVSILRLVARLVRPGGTIAFQEPSWVPFLAASASLPLWAGVLTAIHETFLRSGINPEMGPNLYRAFQDAGLPAPAMHMETPLGCDADFARMIHDLLVSLLPLAKQHHVSVESLGDPATLFARIRTEITAANTMVSFVPLVGAWSRVPSQKLQRNS